MTDVDVHRVAAFEATLREHDRSLRAFAFRLVGSDADDVLQVAYLAAFRSMADFRGESSSATWLHRIVYTTALNHLRGGRRRTRREQASAIAGVHGDFAGDASDRLDLAAALVKLPPDQRAAVLLVDGEGFSYDEAARILGTTSGTVASRLNRARGRLRAVLHTDEEGS